ncbi:hypothetical protein TRL7639_02456 [Falsiruegeria litorea R37]|uniref:Uncharacterized protein n=1 Tax=Falsiruegeria litorea R37 TaxID=1200284 RepID=A0A1Y5SPP4_9RHOB|nr:hypothetical protein TRL7639_02456 [Falsiruegeria litorea R37]
MRCENEVLLLVLCMTRSPVSRGMALRPTSCMQLYTFFNAHVSDYSLASQETLIGV